MEPHRSDRKQMRRLQVLAIGDVEGRTLEAMAVQLAEHFAMQAGSTY